MDDVNTTQKIEKKYLIDKEKLNRLKFIGKILIVVLFVIATTFIAIKHEHWSDEAQSFLLARDNSLFELFHYMKYEGTPPLWVLVLKLFIFLGGTYETLFILPILFSTIGLIIFEFKIKAPWYIKTLLPFTYFIFYQYSIVARSYCMIFPILMLVAAIYEKRLEKPILYSIILFFLMNISLHTLIISGSLYLIFLINIFQNKKFKEKKIIIACILIFMELLLACICTLPAEDCTFSPNPGKKIQHIILEATVGSNLEPLAEIIIAILIAGVFTFTLKKQQIINSFILIVPVMSVLIFITYQGWHIGIIWLILLTIFIINNSINRNIAVKILVTIICLTQIYWSINSANYDINNNYSAAEDVAKYLKENDYEEKLIYGFGYSITAIQPYFDYNIFENRNTDKAFYLWFKNDEEKDLQKLISAEADIYIVSEFYAGLFGDMTRTLLDKGYERKPFEGDTYMKNRIYEAEGYIIYIKGDVTNE